MNGTQQLINGRDFSNSCPELFIISFEKGINEQLMKLHTEEGRGGGEREEEEEEEEEEKTNQSNQIKKGFRCRLDVTITDAEPSSHLNRAAMTQACNQPRYETL